MAEERQARDVWAIGAAYEAYVGRWSRLVAREFPRWLGVPSGSRWLDVGCGTGKLVGEIAERAAPGAVREMVRAGRPGSAIALYVWDYAARGDPRVPPDRVRRVDPARRPRLGGSWFQDRGRGTAMTIVRTLALAAVLAAGGARADEASEKAATLAADAWLKLFDAGG